MSRRRPETFPWSILDSPRVGFPDLDRRALLRSGFLGLGLFASGNWLLGCGVMDENASGSSGDPEAPAIPQSRIPFLGPLEQSPDPNGLRLPAGFTSRVIARSGERPLESSGYVWHAAPDGGAVFPTEDGGWIYVSNSEVRSSLGGVGALRFSAAGDVIDAYSILQGTSRNCAGGLTPWGTWLSCEEVSSGFTYECDPLSPGSQGVVRAGLGTFSHEAAAVDSSNGDVYLTEDRGDSLLYRFRPDSFGDLSSGALEALEILGAGSIAYGEVREISWHTIPDPNRTGGISTRFQAPQASRFNRGEGIWYEGGFCYFASTDDNTIWALDCANQTLEILYRASNSSSPYLTKPDNVTVSAGGDVLAAEDGGDMQIVAITPEGELVPVVQVVGQVFSEMAGPAFDPSGTRLYFSSQRGPAPIGSGITYEISGPFVA